MKFKKKSLNLLALLAIGITSTAQATLIDRGNGLIYDDILDVTWLQDANYAQTSGYDSDGKMTWNNAVTWADGLMFGGYDDWRLPTLAPIDGVAFDHQFSFDGSTDRGYNITSSQSEIAYMFYQNLGNLSVFDTNGDIRGGDAGIDWGLTNVGLFNNLEDVVYWFGVEVAPSSSFAWTFRADNGRQDNMHAKGQELNAWAVHSGDVGSVGGTGANSPAVPAPAPLWLIGSGLMALLTRQRMRSSI